MKLERRSQSNYQLEHLPINPYNYTVTDQSIRQGNQEVYSLPPFNNNTHYTLQLRWRAAETIFSSQFAVSHPIMKTWRHHLTTWRHHFKTWRHHLKIWRHHLKTWRHHLKTWRHHLKTWCHHLKHDVMISKHDVIIWKHDVIIWKHDVII